MPHIFERGIEVLAGIIWLERDIHLLIQLAQRSKRRRRLAAKRADTRRQHNARVPQLAGFRQAK